MDVAGSRFAGSIQRCIWCRAVDLIGVVGLHLVLSVEAAPHAEGAILLRDTGGVLPVAARLTTTQQFGRQGQLHRPHDCPKKGRK